MAINIESKSAESKLVESTLQSVESKLDSKSDTEHLELKFNTEHSYFYVDKFPLLHFVFKNSSCLTEAATKEKVMVIIQFLLTNPDAQALILMNNEKGPIQVQFIPHSRMLSAASWQNETRTIFIQAESTDPIQSKSTDNLTLIESFIWESYNAANDKLNAIKAEDYEESEDYGKAKEEAEYWTKMKTKNLLKESIKYEDEKEIFDLEVVKEPRLLHHGYSHYELYVMQHLKFKIIQLQGQQSILDIKLTMEYQQLNFLNKLNRNSILNNDPEKTREDIKTVLKNIATIETELSALNVKINDKQAQYIQLMCKRFRSRGELQALETTKMKDAFQLDIKRNEEHHRVALEMQIQSAEQRKDVTRQAVMTAQTQITALEFAIKEEFRSLSWLRRIAHALCGAPHPLTIHIKTLKQDITNCHLMIEKENSDIKDQKEKVATLLSVDYDNVAYLEKLGKVCIWHGKALANTHEFYLSTQFQLEEDYREYSQNQTRYIASLENILDGYIAFFNSKKFVMSKLQGYTMMSVNQLQDNELFLETTLLEMTKQFDGHPHLQPILDKMQNQLAGIKQELQQAETKTEKPTHDKESKGDTKESSQESTHDLDLESFRKSRLSTRLDTLKLPVFSESPGLSAHSCQRLTALVKRMHVDFIVLQQNYEDMVNAHYNGMTKLQVTWKEHIQFLQNEIDTLLHSMSIYEALQDKKHCLQFAYSKSLQQAKLASLNEERCQFNLANEKAIYENHCLNRSLQG